METSKGGAAESRRTHPSGLLLMLLLMPLLGLLLGFLLGFLLGVLLALLLGLLLAVLLELPLELQLGLIYHLYKNNVSGTRKIKTPCRKPVFAKTSKSHTFFNDFSKMDFIWNPKRNP